MRVIVCLLCSLAFALPAPAAAATGADAHPVTGAGTGAATGAKDDAAATAAARAAAVRAFVDASNRHDVEAMLAATEPDFRWLQVTGDRIATEVAGHADLRSWLEGYFRTTSDARSEVGEVSVSGEYATTVETVRWTGRDGGARAQSSVSVYRFAPDGRISAVWYYPAQDLAPSGAQPAAAR